MPVNPAKAKVKTSLSHKGTFYSLCLDAAGQVYAGSDDYAVHAFDLKEKKVEPTGVWKKHNNYVSALAALDDFIVSGSYDHQLIWWDPANGKPVRTIKAHAGWIRDLVATPDRKQLVSVGDDMLVKVWDAKTGKLLHSLAGHATRTPQGFVTALYAVAISPDGKHIASGDRIGDVRVWDLASGKQVSNFQVPILYTYDPRQRKRSIGGIRALAFTLDGKELAVGGVGQIGNVDGIGGPSLAEIWDWRKPDFHYTADGKGNGLINHLVYHPGEPILLGGGTDFLAMWPTDRQPEAPKEKDKKATLPAAQRHKSAGNIHRLCLTKTGIEAVTACSDRLEVWAFE
ncbi:MAG: WD40 repeat domain-containing protein [Gemmataceae bacterium]